MPNPLVDQGTLNRLRGSVVVADSPELNVTASYLGEAGIAMSLEGVTTTFINTMAGAVTSPEPYMIGSIVVNLLKTQGLSDIYKQRMESDARIGQITVRPDAATLGNYVFVNCAIESVAPMSLNGRDAGFGVTIKGYYNVNSSLWAA